jgi:DNA recombination protein RmuC
MVLTALLVLAALAVFGVGLLQYRRLAALQGQLGELARSMPAVRETGDRVMGLVAQVGQIQGRLDTLMQGVQRLEMSAAELKPELAVRLAEGLQSIRQGTDRAAESFRAEVSARDERNNQAVAARIESGLRTLNESMAQTRSELATALNATLEGMRARIEELRGLVDGKLGEIQAGTTQSAQTLNETARSTITTVANQMTELRSALDSALKSEMGAIRQENSAKLETIRQTVDDKLHATLEQRLGESFKLVSERLESVHRGLGEMQSLASGVGDLRKVLTNIKTRGTWGEVQLEALLDQVLIPEQYARNVCTKPDSAARVDFAIRLPGRSGDAVVWLPIDAKFPTEDYQRLVDAQERADALAVEEAGRALELRIKAEARSIREKYVSPPHTTEFAILYLPAEGLYAEAIRRVGLVEWAQRECKVNLAGPTTLAALLNSLQMGFRTLAIEQRSAEVWTVLGAVKAEFLKFGDALAKTKKKLEEASNTIDSAQTRSRVLTRKLKDVDTLPAVDSTLMIEEITGIEVSAGDEALTADALGGRHGTPVPVALAGR